MTLAQRLAHIEGRIADACRSAGRPRESVTLIGVSKEQPEVLVREAAMLGVTDLGENRVQAWLTRQAAGIVGVRWHLIGPVQTNKAKLVAKVPPALLHTIDRVSLVEALDKECEKAGTQLDVLIQVDIDEEPQKAGVAVGDLNALVARVVASRCLTLRGLMAIPRPLDEVGEVVLGRSFEAMRRLADEVEPVIGRAAILSLGMSDDFELAIRCGATHVRVGSALFGERPG